MTIIMGADHGGVTLKEVLKDHLAAAGHAVVDVGVDSTDPVDYPDYVGPVVERILSHEADRGILLCGSGIGMSIAANRFPGIRAALCFDAETARLSRAHNDSNILVLAGRKTDRETACSIADAWLTAAFEGGRHEGRIRKIDQLRGIPHKPPAASR